jgi:acyl carrier protein
MEGIEKMSDTLSKVTEVFCDVFDDDEIELELQTTAEDVDAWDSLMHVTLMLNIEKAFGVRFASSEVAGLKNIGELVALIDSKTAVAN